MSRFRADGCAGTGSASRSTIRILLRHIFYDILLRFFYDLARPLCRTFAERPKAPALPQTLFRMTDPSMLAKFSDKAGRARP